MAVTDNTTGGRKIIQGLLPVEVTVSAPVFTGDLIGLSSSDTWVKADAADSELAHLIAAHAGLEGERITAYPLAVVQTSSLDTIGEEIGLSDTEGDIVALGTQEQSVGFVTDPSKNEWVFAAGLQSATVTPSSAFGSGVVAAPSISFVGDGDTGIYRIGANNIGIATAGTQRVNIDAIGNVGLMGVTPLAPLHIADSDGTTASDKYPGMVIHNTSSSGNSYARLYMRANAVILNTLLTGVGGLGVDFGVESNHDFRLKSNNIVRLVLAADGVMTATSPLTWNTSSDPAAYTDQVSVGQHQIGAGNTVLALSQDTAVATDTDETKFSHKMQVRINEATYFIMLTDS